MTQITYTNVIVAETCCNCGVVFGLDSGLRAQRLNDHKTFYCPNGHGQVYSGKTDAEKAREELARANQRLEWAQASAKSWRDQAETAENRRRAQKAANTRLKKRVAAGVCPCCQRSFSSLAEHIATKHPNYAEVQS